MSSDLAALTGHGRRRGGRQVANPRTERVTVRLTPDERAALADLAGPGDVGELFRASVFRRRARLRVTIPEPNREALRVLGRVGNNLNQLTAAAHSGRQALLRELLPTLNELMARVDGLRATLISPAARPKEEVAEIIPAARSGRRDIGSHPGINETLGGDNVDA